MRVALFLIGAGIVMLAMAALAVGGTASGPQLSRTTFWTGIGAAGAIGVPGAAIWLREEMARCAVMARAFMRNRRRAPLTDLASEQKSYLYCGYSPFIVDAATQLGEARDVTAVPDLLAVLEACVQAQRPGWCEVADSLARSLGAIGDDRALPVLYRLETVRGIGFIPAVRAAIQAIEPQTSLLRAAVPGADGLVRAAVRPESDAVELLHPAG